LGRLAALAFILVGAWASDASATERPFTYTYTSGVLGRGEIEIEPWSTWRYGRRDFYSGLDHRLEFEVGVTDRLQWAWYINFSGVGQDIGGVRTQSFASRGVSWEWKLKLLDPVADPIGLALYFEPTLAPGEVELEGKIIVDKRIGRLLLAANAVVEQEWELGSADEAESELLWEVDAGATYWLTQSLAAGIEARSLNEGGFDKAMLSAGPVVSYSSGRWWMAATFLPQIWAPAGADRGRLDLASHERFETRVVLGLHI
jgi:hypothetical protein